LAGRVENRHRSIKIDAKSLKFGAKLQDSNFSFKRMKSLKEIF